MTKATGLGRLPQILEQYAGSKAVCRAFQMAGLPMEVIEFPETWIPLAAMRELFEISARAAGERCFGLAVGQDMTHTAFGLWMHYSAQGDSLSDGVDRVISCSKFQQTGGYMTIERTAPVSFWRYFSPLGSQSRPKHHCDHLIGPLLRFVQSYLGADWMPEWVEVDYPRDAQSRQFEAQLQLPIRYGAPTMALAIRHSHLFRLVRAPSNPNQPITFADVRASEARGPGKEPLDSVFNAITLRLLDGQSDLDGVASLLGVGVQKLQRNLRREGVDYRDLLNRAKQQRAQELLSDTTLPVIDIALSLGYSDHANFSRAFKKMTGLAPTIFRADYTPFP